MGTGSSNNSSSQMVGTVEARTEQTLSSAQSKDREVPQSPRLANPSSLFHEREVPKTTILSTSSSCSQGNSVGHDPIPYQPYLPVGQVRGGNESSSDMPSPTVGKPFDHR